MTSRRGATRAGERRSHAADCASVRPDLPEHALGTLPPERRRGVEEHLAWCAGCRKDARELAEGAALLGLKAAAADPPPALESRVVRAVARRAPARRPRLAALAAAVALLAATVSGGWALAMRQRVIELSDAAESARGRAERFEQTVREIVGARGDGQILSASLSNGREGPGPGGRAILFDARRGEDWALVIVGGLPEEGGPYRGFVITEGRRQLLGRLWPSAPGEMTTYKIFADHDLGVYGGVVVVDRDGRVALRGTLSTGT